MLIEDRSQTHVIALLVKALPRHLSRCMTEALFLISISLQFCAIKILPFLLEMSTTVYVQGLSPIGPIIVKIFEMAHVQVSKFPEMDGSQHAGCYLQCQKW